MFKSTLSILLLTILVPYSLCLPPLCNLNSTTINDMNCSVLSYGYSDMNASNITPKNELVMMEYNIAASGYGTEKSYGIGYILSEFINETIPIPDVLYMSEITRDCISHGDYVDAIEFIAKNLKMNAVYSVAYIELEN